ncbi:MAG: OsmC family protein [Candidatus Portiera sp.]|nr:OsmC family protein [Portiera sp.]
MEVKVTWQEGVYFHGQAGKHTLAIEGPPESGGKNRGVRPMESVLIGLASCSAYDVVSILAKSRQPLAKCEVDVTAQRADSVPKVFTKIQLHFRFAANEGAKLDDEVIARAIDLSVNKYCSVSQMLTAGGVQIEHSHTLEELSANSNKSND